MRALLGWWLARRGRHAEARADVDQVSALTWAWRLACIGAGLGRDVATVSGPTTSTPRLVHVTLGPPTVLLVELMPGQLPADVLAVAGRLAPHLGARALRVASHSHRHALVQLLHDDPLAGDLGMPEGPSATLLLARDEQGREVRATPLELPHLVVQGQTRSGKSAWCYALLGQLARRADVLVAGVDPTGLLLRPFAGTRHAALQALGLGDVGRISVVLGALVAEMDRRVAALGDRADQVTTGPACPVIVVVLEEWPGVLRVLEQTDPKGAARHVRAAVSRLLAEGHKAGIRVVLVCQRADAAVIGGAERANIGARISFRVDNADAVRMLHPSAGPDVVAEHAAAPPGVALVELPGLPLTRARGPWIGGYGAYVDLVTDSVRVAQESDAA